MHVCVCVCACLTDDLASQFIGAANTHTHTQGRANKQTELNFKQKM